ncbi:MAG: DNA polymerase III subunit beta [Alcanivoracaceae bacterium]|nr:DNA polymerase III subunit beta [Alcanivoracaceae bacterium]|tara:strand:+ start:182 stop:571 length:390 start_codon:yes stop_codon:yes gene_type:complete
MTATIESIRDYLQGDPDVCLAYVFGSVATGMANKDSDLDVAIQLKQELSPQRKAAMISELACLTGRPVDLIDLKQAGEPLLGEILRNGRRIKGSHSQHVELVQRHIYNTEDFLPIVRRLLSERRQQWTH